MIFLDCANEVLMKRYRETRRVHPLSPDGLRRGGHRDASARCSTRSSQLADLVIDTSALNVHQLQGRRWSGTSSGEARADRGEPRLLRLPLRHARIGRAALRRALPAESRTSSAQLRPRTGLGRRRWPTTCSKSERGRELLRPAARAASTSCCRSTTQEGKAYLTIGVGCTGGRHRSVAIAEAAGASDCASRAAR